MTGNIKSPTHHLSHPFGTDKPIREGGIGRTVSRGKNIHPVAVHDGMHARGRTGIIATHGSALSALESGTSNPVVRPPAGKKLNRHPASANKGRVLVANPQAVGRKILAQAIALASDPHHPRHFDCGDN